MDFFTLLLFPFSLLYQFLFFLFKVFIKPVALENTRVISVGNLTMGGTGKTPHVIHIANLLYEYMASSIDVTILTRGYGGRKTAQGMLVQTATDPLDAGDEPVLIKKKIPFAHVIMGKNRYENFLKWKVNTEKTQFVLLDDGFQHLKIKRDIDIVLIDSETGIGNGLTIPAGTLREPLSALERADAVVFTKYEKGIHPHLLEKKIFKKHPNIKIFFSRYIADGLSDGHHEKPMHDIHGKKVFLFSGIARPSSFIKMICDHEPAEWKHIDFRDHMKYTPAKVKAIMEQADGYDLVICTEKDFVKLASFDESKRIMFVKISLSLENSQDFVRLITNGK